MVDDEETKHNGDELADVDHPGQDQRHLAVLAETTEEKRRVVDEAIDTWKR